ncbi:MAG: AraC family transcriptional regulator [Clostridiales bacterium]|nr:AraC family transcriptional regulator [Clostridiales bacterium]MBR6484707.1 AraC family transcriptional regulator [Clostridiales bacterium]
MDRMKLGLIVKRDDGSEIVNYDDPTFPSYIYDGWVKPKVTWERVPHYHKDIEINTVTYGQMAYSVNGKTIILNKGDTIIVNSNQIHYSMSISEEKAKYVICVIDPAILMSTVAVEMKYIRPIIDNPDIAYLRFRDYNENAEKMYDLVTALPDMRNDPFSVTLQFFKIWKLMLRYSETLGILESDEGTDQHMIPFKTMMHYISENYQGTVTLDEIAGSANISKSLCNIIFHKYVGESPVNYLMHFRLRKVAEYLRSSSFNMTDIAELVGFKGVSYMSESFKKYYGMTPRDYKKDWSQNSINITG